MNKKIEQLKKELKELEKQENIDRLKTRIPYDELAKIGQSNMVSDKARLEYEELFDDFVKEKIGLMKQDLERNWSRKKFVFKIGFE